MIVGLGTDIVEVDRIGKMIADHGDHFLARVFTAGEIEHCQTSAGFAQHYAGRWAAKEAVMKALGTGFTPDVNWTDIEVLVKPSGQYCTSRHLHGNARTYRRRPGHRRDSDHDLAHANICHRDSDWPRQENQRLNAGVKSGIYGKIASIKAILFVATPAIPVRCPTKPAHSLDPADFGTYRFPRMGRNGPSHAGRLAQLVRAPR